MTITLSYSIMFVSCIAFWAAVLGYSPIEAAVIATMIISAATILACASAWLWRQ